MKKKKNSRIGKTVTRQVTDLRSESGCTVFSCVHEDDHYEIGIFRLHEKKWYLVGNLKPIILEVELEELQDMLDLITLQYFNFEHAAIVHPFSEFDFTEYRSVQKGYKITDKTFRKEQQYLEARI